MDISEILKREGFSDHARAVPFQHEEDDEYYNVWRVTDGGDICVLKSAKAHEMDVYNTFLGTVGRGVPRLYKSLRCEGEDFLLMEYIEGESLQKCDRGSLQAALDALIYIQEPYWEKRELQHIGFGFEASLPGRRERGKYLRDPELERAYETYLRLYSSLPRTLCHDDLLPFNVLVSHGTATIIDWEYAGILPYPTSLARLIAHGAENEDAFFYIREDDKAYAIDYYYEHLAKGKGIRYDDYRHAVDYFLFYEYCEWIMLGEKYNDTESERYKEYCAKARQLLSRMKN